MSATDEESKSTPSQRSYGRGLFDGIRLAGVSNPEDLMNNVRMKSIEQNLSGIAKKVYEVLPFDDQLSVSDVVSKIAALGSRPDHSIVKGVLGDLLEKGLIRGNGMDRFQRIPPKPVVVSTKPVEKPQIDEKLPDKKLQDPFERLADLECRMKALGSEVVRLANEVADTAVDVGDFVSRIKAENEKMLQLKALLKDLA